MSPSKISLIFFVGLLLVASVFALPTGPTTITVLGSSRYPTTSPTNVTAIAGNVTEINFGTNGITQTWQGYFGNISGTIILGDSNNNTLYDWNSASPSGQIYATRNSSTPNWAIVRCANSTEINSEDTALGVNESNDQDSADKTFLNTTTFNQFYVGNKIINTSQDCYAVQLFNSSAQPSTDFQELLLSDNSSMIYTSLITKNSVGFDNRTHDFEMLVGENGHLGDATATPYYFYLELG